jgi:GNAT superfamily N-acetyltransferase
VIRHARRDEAARIKEIRLRALAADPDGFSTTYERDAARPDSWWERLAALSDAGEEQRTFVYECDGEWLGLIIARRDDDHPPDATINATWVAPQVRGRGIAKALTAECVEWARACGFPAIGVAVVAGNEPARRAYEAEGFVEAFRTVWAAGGGRVFDLFVLKQRL